MPHIQQLSPHVADLIAAGEVVERPASVVKELLENSIDAGASAVTVELRGGGMTYLRVSDDGCGIPTAELPTAFLRHATSKLRTAADLAAIGTLGFRGEALAAISSVSRLDVFTREHGAESGAALHLEGGVPGEIRPAGCPEGTSIIVRDLFYNTPARLKFMKRDSAEAAAIGGIVNHIALSRPDISFKLIRDNTETLHTPGDGVLRSAVYAALGREFTLSLTEAAGRDGALAADGFVTRPLCGRGNRAMQTFFVNGRFVKSQLLTAALEEAYANRILKGKYPGCVLSVTLPPDTVDANVHPAKTIVKFVSEKQVFDLVYHSVMDALDREEKHTDVSVPPRGFYQHITVEQFRAVQPPIPAVSAGERGGTAPACPAPSRPTPTAETCGDFTARVPVRPTVIPIAAPAAVTDAAPVQTALTTETAAPWRIVGEVLDTYVVCEDAEHSVWFVDKHAAHERVVFNRLKAQNAPAMSQTLLTPLVAQLGPDEYAAASENFGLLRSFGFVCEDFGGNAVLIRAIPADLNRTEAVAALEELAGKLAGGSETAASRDTLLATLACKSAIKGGHRSDERELRALVDRVQSGEIAYCPHGRPVKVKLTQRELEKMFKRIV